MEKGIIGFFVFFFLIISFGFSACNNTITAYFPAITSISEGNVLSATIETMSGTGKVFLDIETPIGISTQRSIETAKELAIKYAKKRCDIVIDFEKKYKLIEGPSGGANFFLAMYSALTEKKMREDSIITGGVDKEGRILPVGGIVEKIKSAEKRGYKYFVTAPLSFQEKLYLGPILSNMSIKIIEVEDVEELLDFFYENKTPKKKKDKLEIPEMPNVSEYTYEKPDFKDIAEWMVKEEEKLLEGIENEELREYVRKNIEIEKNLTKKGYYFTAANDAFLSYISIKTILGANKEGLEEASKRIEECIKEISFPEYNDKNFEWVAGGKLRKKWAEKNLEEINAEEPETFEERIYLYHELLYSDAWCMVAKVLADKGEKIKGKKIDTTKLRFLALKKYNEMKRKRDIDPSLYKKMINAQEFIEKGEYLPAILELAYVKAFYESKSEEDQERMWEEIIRISAMDFKSQWARIYLSQGIFYIEKEDVKTGYQLVKYAEEIEKSYREIEKEIKNDEKKEDKKKGENRSEDKREKFFLFIMTILFPLLLIGVLRKLLRNRKAI